MADLQRRTTQSRTTHIASEAVDAVERGALYSRIQDDVLSRNPVVILGCGSSIACGLTLHVSFPGMDDLASALRRRVGRRIKNRDAKAEWRRCLPLLASGLETALAAANPRSEQLLTVISDVIGETIGAADVAFLEAATRYGLDDLPLCRLLRYLLRSLGGAGGTVHVITPNYDHVVELACDHMGVPCITGFTGARVRQYNAETARRVAIRLRPKLVRGKQQLCRETVAHVKLYKPHGSLNWVAGGMGAALEVPAVGSGMHRILAVPGEAKYKVCVTTEVLDDHREQANSAVSAASAALIYGYGFNDPHLELALSRRLAAGMPAVILARQLTPNARAAAERHPSVIALECAEGTDQTALCYVDGSTHSLDCGLWSLGRFITEMLGVQE